MDIKNDLYLVIKNGDVQKLIENYIQNENFDINQHYSDGMKTLLHYSISYNQINCVKILVENRADVNARDSKKMTPLHYAALENNVKIIKYLILNGAHVNKEDLKN